MNDKLAKLADISTVLVGISALIAAGTLIGGKSSPAPAPEPVTVSEWQQYAHDGHRWGPEDAPVTIVEFGDYECPFCKDAVPHLKKILDDYGDEVALVYRHLPLPGHSHAYAAALAAECAADQDVFWSFHDLLWSNDAWIGAESRQTFLELAALAGVEDEAAFRTCIDEEAKAASVHADEEAARELLFTGTPSFLVNGQRHIGVLDSTRFARIYEELRH